MFCWIHLTIFRGMKNSYFLRNAWEQICCTSSSAWKRIPLTSIMCSLWKLLPSVTRPNHRGALHALTLNWLYCPCQWCHSLPHIMPTSHMSITTNICSPQPCPSQPHPHPHPSLHPPSSISLPFCSPPCSPSQYERSNKCWSAKVFTVHWKEIGHSHNQIRDPFTSLIKWPLILFFHRSYCMLWNSK